MNRRIAALLALTGMVLLAAGCNTIQGAGRDVKAAGSAIEKAADRNKPKTH